MSRALPRAAQRVSGISVALPAGFGGDRLRVGWLNGFLFTTSTGVPPEQKMLKGHLPRVIYHQVYYKKIISVELSAGLGGNQRGYLTRVYDLISEPFFPSQVIGVVRIISERKAPIPR